MKSRLSTRLVFLFLGFALIAQAQSTSQNTSTVKPSVTGAEYRLGPEDLVEVFVLGEPDLRAVVVVRPDGWISLPGAGEVNASGKTAMQLQGEIVTRLKQYYTTPLIVNVMVKEVNSPKISILGQVRRPDVYRIRQKTTVLDAIALAGGFTEFAKRDRVRVIRSNSTGREDIKLDLMHEIKDSQAPVFCLEPSDTVYVE